MVKIKKLGFKRILIEHQDDENHFVALFFVCFSNVKGEKKKFLAFFPAFLFSSFLVLLICNYETVTKKDYR